MGFEVRSVTLRVSEELCKLKLRPHIFPGKAGLICDIRNKDGAQGGPVVLLRADLDALPMDDEKDVPYKSRVPGRAHACGHDVHTAVLIGVARVLVELAEHNKLPWGTVRLLFQPAEEETTGALWVIGKGALTGVDRIFALHCDPRLEVGQVGHRPGPVTASCDDVLVTLKGPGGHTGAPNLTVDTVRVLGELIVKTDEFCRQYDPRVAMTIAWGMVQAGSVPNVIPGEGKLLGTVRCLDGTLWEGLPEQIVPLIHEIAAPFNTGDKLTVSVEYDQLVPPTVNDEDSTSIFWDATTEILGERVAVEVPQRGEAEDFGQLTKRVPGALAWLGCRTPGAEPYSLHQPTFDVDPFCIEVGVTVLANTALKALAVTPPGTRAGPISDH